MPPTTSTTTLVPVALVCKTAVLVGLLKDTSLHLLCEAFGKACKRDILLPGLNRGQ